MKWQSFRFMKRRKPIRRTAARTRLAIEELESRLLLSTNVLTYEYDNANSGVDSTETQLTPANVSSGSFGKLFSTALDGQVYAQPLVDTGVTINSGPYTTPGAAGVHNVVFVATENDSLYAIDADPSSSGEILWQRSFLNANDPNDALPGATSVTAVPALQTTNVNDITPTYGITSTPVIDPSTNTLYVIAATQQMVDGVVHYVQTLHAINISNGTDATTSFVIGDTTGINDDNTSLYVYGDGPGSVTDPYNGTGQQVVQFNARYENSRAALRVVNGMLYAEWSAHGGGGGEPYYGWIAAWNVSDLANNGLQLSGVFNTDPDGGNSGIWQGGAGLTFTPDGNDFYFAVGSGNGSITLDSNGFPTDGDYREAVVEATLDPSTTPQNQNENGWGFQVVQYFIPAEGGTLGNDDKDFDTGVALLPASAGIPGDPDLLVAGDKLGQLFVLDADDLGGFDTTNQNVLDAATNAQGEFTAPSYFNGLISTPVYFNGQLYVVGSFYDPAKAFTIDSDGSLVEDSQTPTTNLGWEPGSPVISANGTQDGIVWILDSDNNELQAYDADNLGDELWNSGEGANAHDPTNKFTSPTVANGMVFVGTSDSLTVYGLNSPTEVSQAPTLTATALSGTSVNLSWQDPSQLPNVASAYVIEESTDGVNFTEATTAAQGATSLTLGGLDPGMTYYFRIYGLNSVGNSPYSNVVTATPSATVNFSGGFAGSSNQLTYNGAASINGNVAELTDGGANELASVFTNTPVNIDSFQSQFSFQLTPNSPDMGDGFTFTIQNAGANAVGPTGGGLGYGPDTPGGSGGIAQSVAIKFDLYNNAGEGNDSTGLYTDGASPTVPAIDLSNTGINLHNGDVFQVNLGYDGTTLTVVITDTNTGATATQNYTIDIPGMVGGDSAYVGFTGGSGGYTAIQDILNWSFDSSTAPAPAVPTGLTATPASGHSIALSWTNSSSNQTGFYLDRATDAGFTQNLITEAVPGGVSSFTDTASGLTPGVTYYYRLRAYNASGSSANTASVAVTIPPLPPAPSNPSISGATANTISLRWKDNAGSAAEGYQIYRSTAGGAFTLVATLPSGSTSWTDTNLSAGTTYEYHLVAFNLSGSSGYADAVASTSPVATASPKPAAGAPSLQASLSLLTSLFDLEIDAFLLVTYLEEGDLAEVKQMWSDIASNPLIDTSLGMFALEQGLALAKPSGGAK